MKRMTFRGLYPATVTPFNADLSLDFDGLRNHLKATAGVDGVKGLVVNGHLGEILSLGDDEKAGIVRVATEVRRPGQTVVAGLEARNLAEAVAQGRKAREAGADALLVFPPVDVRPYRRLSRHVGPVVEFFEVLDREVGLPMVIFQYPDSSGCSYSVEVLDELAKLENVVGVKAATENVLRYTEVWDALHEELSILPACDAPALLGMLLHGAHGSLIGISVIGPEHWVSLVAAALGGRAEEARRIFNGVCIPIMNGVWENNEPRGPTSVVAATKEALVQLGQFPCSKVRPLAVDVTAEIRERIRVTLIQVGLLEPALV